MFVDTEGFNISLPVDDNRNFILVGETGKGKSYLNCRLIEKAVKNNRNILIIDYTGSYAESELITNKLELPESVRCFDISEEKFSWKGRYCNDELYKADVADALISALGISGELQANELRKQFFEYSTPQNPFKLKSFVNFLKQKLEEIQKESNNVSDGDSLKKIIERVSSIKLLDHFSVKNDVSGIPIEEKGNLTILQLNNLGEKEQLFCTTLILELIWREQKNPKEYRHCSLIVLDEYQDVYQNCRAVFKNIMCKGRKHGLNVIVSTQFLSQYNEKDLDSFSQNANFVIFKPSMKGLKSCKEIISYSSIYDEDLQIVEKYLKAFDVGDVFFCGKYVVNHGTRTHTRPIVCKVKAK